MKILECAINYIQSVNNNDTEGIEEIYNSCYEFINGCSTKKQDEELSKFFKLN